MKDAWFERDNPFGFKTDSWDEDGELWLAATPRIVKVSKAILVVCSTALLTIAGLVAVAYVVALSTIIFVLPTALWVVN